MAAVPFATLELAYRADGGTVDIATTDLKSYVVVPDGWIMSTSSDSGPVDEVLTLNVKAASVDALATAMQGIDLRVTQIEWSRDPREFNGVWLRVKPTGATNAQQAYLVDGRRGNQVRLANPAMWSDTLLQYPLGVTRMAGWETLVAQQIPASPGSVSAHGGTVAYSTAGDIGGRIALTTITAAGTANLNEFWLGVKSENYGGVNPANFVPFWGIDKRSYTRGSEVTEESDANAVCGKHLKVSLSTAGAMSNIFGIRVNAVTANVADQRGKYVLLARCLTDDTNLEYNIRCGQGYMIGNTLSSSTFSYGDPVQIIHAQLSYRYYAVGEFDIPPIPSVTAIDVNQAAIVLQAEKVAGSGNLYIDGFLLIPAEHSIHVLTTQSLGSSPYTLYLITTPDRRYRSVVSFVDTGVESVIEQNPPDQLNWSLPPGDGVIVCGANGVLGRTDDVLQPILKVYPSFSTLRGSA